RMLRLMIAALLVSCGSGSYLDHLNKCEVPRQGFDQVTGRPYPDKGGSAAEERAFLKGWSDDTYLWYRDLPNPDQKSFASTIDYFMALKSPATTASGALRDRFHFFYD